MIESTLVGDGEILLDPANGEFLRLNPSAVCFFEGLRAGLSEEQIAERVSALFGIDDRRARHDVGVFAAGLRARGAIRGG
ncbi:PqqD family protein [Amycolatopsis sp. NPDC004378]